MNNPNLQSNYESITCRIQDDINEHLNDGSAISGKRAFLGSDHAQVDCDAVYRYVAIHDPNGKYDSMWCIGTGIAPSGNTVTWVETGIENGYVSVFSVNVNNNSLETNATPRPHGEPLVIYDENLVFEPSHVTTPGQAVIDIQRQEDFHERLSKCIRIDYSDDSVLMSAEQAQVYLDNLHAKAQDDEGK